MADVCDISLHRAQTENNIPDYPDSEAEEHAKEVGAVARPAETRNEINENGTFVRQPNAFIVPFGNKEGQWKAETGRYSIYWAKFCNWSNRPVIARDLLGLKNVIKDHICVHTGETNIYGWGFGDQKDHKDPATGAYFLSEFYKHGDPGYKGRATTPAFVDVIEKKTVNNDYHRLSNYIEVQFRAFQPKDAPDLYPKKYRAEIDEFNDWLFPHVNNGSYRMGFCQSYRAYKAAYDDFYASLDSLEKRLSENRFIFGDYVTDSDIRLFVTLIRWELAYYRNLGPQKKRISEYKNLWGYVKELYSIPAFRDNSYLADIADFGPRTGNVRRPDFYHRIGRQIPYEEEFTATESRAYLSAHPDTLFLAHPDGETAEDYQSEISFSPWNRPAWEDRNPENPLNGTISVDPSVNPLKGLL